jgi:dTDP-4-dehydrorhamnose reductase
MRAAQKRILVTGRSGLLGTNLIRRFRGKYDITAASRKPASPGEPEGAKFVALDLYDLERFKEFLDGSHFDIIVNCAAMSDVDRCQVEREEARRINVDAVAAMADYCRRENALLLHISTDYVFDGSSGPYSENARPAPINHYGLTKLEAEKSVLSSGCRHIIVRTNHIYGNGPGGPSKLIRWIIDAGKEGRKILAARDQFNNPTYAGNLADGIAALMESRFVGVINIAGADYVSRLEFALVAAEIFGVSDDNIESVALEELKMAAPRPLRAGLTTGSMKQILNIEPVGIRDGLRQVYDGVR